MLVDSAATAGYRHSSANAGSTGSPSTQAWARKPRAGAVTPTMTSAAAPTAAARAWRTSAVSRQVARQQARIRRAARSEWGGGAAAGCAPFPHGPRASRRWTSHHVRSVHPMVPAAASARLRRG